MSNDDPTPAPSKNHLGFRIDGALVIWDAGGRPTPATARDRALWKEIERLMRENATLRSVCKLWGLNEDPEHEANVAKRIAHETSGCSWQPIETAPKDGRTLLLGYYNACGKWRTLRGQWFSRAEIDEWENGESCDEGWYETSVEADDIPSCWATEPTHWQPTPRPPLKASECQHDRFKPGFTLEWLGSTPQLKANTHRFMCKVCRETFDLAIGEAQLSQKASARPAHRYDGQERCVVCNAPENNTLGCGGPDCRCFRGDGNERCPIHS